MTMKRRKELKQRLEIQRTINMVKKQLGLLESQKYRNIEVVKQARMQNVESYQNMAVNALKITLQQIQRTQEMLLMFEILSQLKDMSATSKAFAKSVRKLSKQIVKVSDPSQFVKVQEEFDLAIGGVVEQTAALESLMEASGGAYKKVAEADKNPVGDDEIEKYVDGLLEADLEHEKRMEQDISDIVSSKYAPKDE